MRGQQAKKNWRHRVLGDLGEVVSGGTPSRTAPAFWNGNIPWATPTDITRLQDKYISNTAERITENGLEGSSAHLLPAGSLLVTSRATLGEAAITTVPIATNQGFKSIVPNAETHRVFAYYLVKTLKPKMLPLASGTTFLEIGKGDFCRIPVLIPDFDEQSRIAYVLDTIDEAIQKTEAVIAKLKQIRAGMLHDLLTYGQDKDGKLRDPVAHPEQFKDSEIGRIPKEWEVVAVQEICNTYAGGTPSRSVPGFFGGDIPWVKSTEANRAAIAETEETISTQGFNASSVKWIPAGVPLMAMYGATAGQVTWLTIRATSNQAVLAIVPAKEAIEARCLYWILRRETPKIVLQATGSGQPNLSKALIDKWLIAFPKEPSEQHAIAIALDQSVQNEATEHARMQKLRSLKAGLMHDLLSGDVPVPEDLLPEGVPT